MKLVVGLGNPGAQYASTRHNIGFRVLDALAKRWSAPAFAPRWQGMATVVPRDLESVWLLKTQTFMNLSVTSVAQEVEALGVDPDDLPDAPRLFEALLIVTDDVALPLGRLRSRGCGSCGGHNGLASLEAALGSTEYPRMRIGVAPATADAKAALVTGEELVNFVLGPFAPEEEKLLEQKVIPAAVDAVTLWLQDGLEACQRTYNGWCAQAVTTNATSAEDEDDRT